MPFVGNRLCLMVNTATLYPSQRSKATAMTTHKTITLDETERMVLSSIIADRRGVLALTLLRKRMSAHTDTPRVQGEMRRIERADARLADLLERLS